jgi:carboxyl-terminal processing protease
MANEHTRTGRGKAAAASTAAAVLFLVLLLGAPALLAQDSNPYYSVMENVFSFILDNYVDAIDPEVLYQGALKGMFESLNDPYSVFLDESMMSDLSDTTSGKFGGVGLYISKQEKDPRFPDKERYIEIVSPIEDTPGWKAGLSPGDLIVEIEGESTAALATDDAVQKLRGEPNTPVNIKVLRGNALFPAAIVRAIIEIPTVKKAVLPDGTGYMRIIEFTPQTLSRVREAISSFNVAKTKSVVIDLRNNPGGLLSSVVQIADLFLTEGPIVTTKSRNAEENYSYQAKSDLLLEKNVPLVVLINRGSASASEILAGALKDQKRAYLVGETTYGKGSVQQVYPLGKTGFKMTMSRYYTPSDANIDKTGIPPDLEVKSPKLTDAQVRQVEDLIVSGKLKDWAETHQSASKADIGAFVKSLALKDFGGYDYLVERMVKDEINRKSIAPVYDLDYDETLKTALSLFGQGKDLPSLISSAKTVRQYQDEVAASKPPENGTTAQAKQPPAKGGSGLPSPELAPPK